MIYEGQICRGPMERSSFMLPVAVGCSYNRCRFCNLFKHLKYRQLPMEQVEEEIDQTTEALRNHHVDRLKNKKCSARNGMLYLDMLTNLERIGDHAENIATSVDKEAPSATR